MSDIFKILREINDKPAELTAWESGFVESINDAMDAPDSSMTATQAAKLEEIHERIYG